MTDPALIERITRSLAFMLRHQPETFDLELDPHGFSDLDDVVHALNERLGEPVEEEDVRAAVSSGDRPRYQIEGDRIRALYGHSIPVEPGPSTKPPEFLYVAIPAQELERARRFGLRGGRRRFLHLAITKEDAAESGRRASRSYAILLIHALDAWEEGVSFYDRTALWLAEEVPTHLLEVEGTYDDGSEPLRRHDGPRERGSGYGHERSDHGHAHSHGHGDSRGDGRGRRRRRGGRGRERQQGERYEGSRPPREAEAPRAEPAFEREPPPAYSAPRGSEGEPRRDSRSREEAPREREGHGSPGPTERGVPRDDRRDVRREEPREERVGERRDERRGRDDFRPERPARSEPAGREERGPGTTDGRSRERGSEPPRRERSAVPASAPGSGFGAGLEAQEAAREREREREPRPTPPPRPAPPPRQEPPADDTPRFGAGL